MSAFSYKHLIGVMYLFVASMMATSVFADDMGGDVDPQPIVLAGSGTQRPYEPQQEKTTNQPQFESQGSQPSGTIAIHAPSGPLLTTTSDSWQDIPNMRGRLTTKETSSITVAFCAETAVKNGKRLFVRALVDGQAATPGDQIMTLYTQMGARTVTFTKRGVGAGTHMVKMQWLADGPGKGYVSDRVLAAYQTAETPIL